MAVVTNKTYLSGDLAVTIIKGPIGVLVGIVYGFVMGILLWYLPAKDSVIFIDFDTKICQNVNRAE